LAYRTRVDPHGPIVQAGQGHGDVELAELTGTWLYLALVVCWWGGLCWVLGTWAVMWLVAVAATLYVWPKRRWRIDIRHRGH